MPARICGSNPEPEAKVNESHFSSTVRMVDYPLFSREMTLAEPIGSTDRRGLHTYQTNDRRL